MSFADPSKMVVKEEAVLCKYDEDLTAEQIASGEYEPVEKIITLNGEVIEHWIKEDN